MPSKGIKTVFVPRFETKYRKGTKNKERPRIRNVGFFRHPDDLKWEGSVSSRPFSINKLNRRDKFWNI